MDAGIGLDAVGKDLLGGGEQVLFPILDESGVDAELAGQFVDGLDRKSVV